MDASHFEKAYEFMCQIKQDLKTKNRFSTDIRFDRLIELYAKEDHNSQYLQKGKTLYRARIYTEKDAESRFNNPPTGTRFKGYDANNSFVNLDHKNVSEGRCNPQYIPYLYISESVDCCIHEIRPSKNAYISVARIKTEDSLKILRLRAGDGFITDHGRSILEGVPDVTMFMYLAQEFSRPHKDFGDYLLCQYVSEKVKSLGFDGIAYESAIYDGKKNVNYVIFNYSKCKVTSSSMWIVSDVQIEAYSQKELSK